MYFENHLRLTGHMSAFLLIVASLITTKVMANPDKQIAQIDAYLTQSVSNGFSGAVLIAQHNQVLLNKGYGFADRESQRVNTADTIFDIGSVTKQFTATAILKLVEQEKLQVTDTLGRFFKDLPADKTSISIHHLLTHSAGITDSVGNGDFDHIETEQYFKAVFASPLAFEPGAKHRYSNAGYSILARIVELVSGMEYEPFVHKYLFKPAGMENTGYLIPDWNPKLLAKGYRYSAFDIGSMATRYKADGKISWVLKGNGGFNSTLGDMYKWYQALTSYKILPESLVDTLTTPYVKENEEGSSHYAYGWAIFTSPRDTKVIAHNGSNGTFYYDFVWFPEEKTFITLATNALVRDAMELGIYLEEMLFNAEYSPPPFALDITSRTIKMALNHTGDADALVSKVKSELGDMLTSRHILNRAGLALMRHEHVTQSIGLLRLNLELFPGDGNLWDSLGEAYLANNQNAEAKEAFETALAFGESSDRCYWCENSQQKLEMAKQKLL